MVIFVVPGTETPCISRQFRINANTEECLLDLARQLDFGRLPFHYLFLFLLVSCRVA